MNHLLKELYQVDQEICRSTTLKETFDIILQRGLPVVKANSGQLKIIDIEQDRLVTVASLNITEPPEETRRSISDRWICGKAVVRQEVIHIPNLDENQYFRKKVKKYDGTEYGEFLKQRKAQLAIPLRVRNEIVGVFDIHSHQYDPFTQDEIYFLEFLANRAAAAVASAKSFGKISLLQEISESVSGQLDLFKLINTIQQEAKRLIPTLREVCILIRDENTGQLLPVFKHIPLTSDANVCTLCDVNHPTIHLAIKNSAISISHVELDSGEKPRYHFKVAMPMFWQDNIIGVIIGEGESDEKFNQFEQELWVRLSRVAAKAVQGAIRFAEAENEIEQRRFQIEVMNMAGQIINSSYQLTEVLSLIMTEGLALLGEKNKSFVVMLHDPESNCLVTKVGGGEFFSPELIGKRQDINQGIAGWVFRNQQPYLSPDINQDSNYIPRIEKTLSELAVPLIHNHKVLGVLDIESSDLNDFDDEHQMIVMSLANYAAIAIRNAQLYDEARDQERLKHELHLAQQIQHHLLSAQAPDIPGLEVAALALSAQEVGGDFYDFVTFDDPDYEHHLGIVIADVSGKGIPAGIVMATSKSIFRIQASEHIHPAEVMQFSNQWLCRDLQKDMFVALAYAVIDTHHYMMHYSLGGQPLPMLLRKNEDDEIVLESMEPRYPLGFRPDILYQERSIPLEPGDILIFYTDGLIEAMNDKQEIYELEQVKRIICENADKSSRQIAQLLVEDVKKFTDEAAQNDDLTLVVVKIKEL